ncbi:MAG: hypothetical protein U0136_00880 [Bdellovibrionota bacterium]
MNRSLLYVILLLAFFLRIVGITWGLPSDANPVRPLQPDEQWAVEVMGEMNWANGDFNPDQAHREGTLAYTIWTSVAIVAQKAGLIPKLAWEIDHFDSSYGRLLLLMRLVNVFADCLSVVLAFLCVRALGFRVEAGLWSAFLFAVLPFELIYAHYGRTHAISNSLIMAACFAAAPMASGCSAKRTALCGFLCGCAAASRYPAAAVALVPLGALTIRFVNRWRENDVLEPGPAMRWARDCTIVVVFLFIGFILCDPYFFLEIETTRRAIDFQAKFFDQSQFGPVLFDTSKIRRYLTYLLPAGVQPYLWLYFYLTGAWLAFQPRLFRATLPLIGYLLVYFLIMAKGYCTDTPIFIRAMYGVFPGCALLAGIASDFFWKQLSKSVTGRRAAVGMLAGIVLPSILFDLAYVSAMQGEDSRTELRRYFLDAQRVEGRPLVVGVFPAFNNFVVLPALDGLDAPHPKVQFREDFVTNPGETDYVITAAFEPHQFPLFDKQSAELVASGSFARVLDLARAPSLLGYEFSVENNPHDLQYPFPRLSLFKRVRE